jgi:hypothetical protein
MKIPASPKHLALTLGALGLLATSAQAALVTSWSHYTGSTSSNLGTASPIIGNGTAGSTDNQTLYAVIGTNYTLADGDSLKFSGSVNFEGLATPQADQFRFGVYDVNGQAGATGWLGYFASNTGTSVGPTNSRLWERNDPNTGSFGSGTGATQLATTNATVNGVTNNTGFASGTYNLSLTYTRVGNDLKVDWSITGTIASSGLPYVANGTFTDTTPETYVFNRVGLFFGAEVNGERASFSNLDLTYTAVPEPAGITLLLGGLALVAIRRRRPQA